MSIIAEIILIIVLLLLGISLLIFIIPFSYCVSLKTHNADLKGEVSVGWLRGVTEAKIMLKEKKLQVRLFKRTILTQKLEKKIVKTKKKNRQKDEKKSSRKIKLNKLEIKKLVKIFKDFSSEIFKITKPKCVKVYGKYGLDDPSVTGIVAGIVSILNNIENLYIEVFPTFKEKIIEAEVEISGKFKLISLMAVIFKTIIKKPVRKLIFNKKR